MYAGMAYRYIYILETAGLLSLNFNLSPLFRFVAFALVRIVLNYFY